MNQEAKRQFEDIIEQMALVYKHDSRPWMIGYSGGKDSTLLCQLTFEMIESLAPEERKKKVYIVTSDTMVENPIVKRYMHNMSKAINAVSAEKHLNIESHIIYPEVKNRFWSLVIGLGYPTPEAPGFRWCTDRLKILPSNAFTYNVIRKDGEIVILLGVRKAESASRSRSITSREIEGKILTPHDSIPKAYVYSPLSEIENKDVWEYLLKDDGKSAWGTDNRYLYSLYQGEEMGEEQSVVGEVNKDKIAITGNSRFGCWCCTMVKEDKSLKNFIDHGSTELIPLREYRNWLVELRRTPEARDYRRRNGAVYLMKNGEFGRGPFTLETRKKMLRRLLELQKSSGFELISEEELKFIDKVWEQEGDLTCRAVVDIYYDVMGVRLPWDQYKKAKYDRETLDTIHQLCEKHDVPFDLMSRLMSAVDNSKFYTRSSETTKEVEKVLNQGWLHFNRIREELEDDTKKIELNNFGSYKDYNVFDLDTSNPEKKIVIIGGKNGAGKTTLFVAVELALYGHYCFGYKNPGKRYIKKVMTYINDRAKMNEDEKAYITIEFSDSTNGDLDQYRITRLWTWKKGEPKEEIQVIKNGKELLNQDLIDFQTFLLRLIPPTLLKLCFFDGERIAEYLLDDQKNNVRDALMILSGNDTFDIMYSSVKKVLASSESEDNDAIREYLEIKSKLQELKNKKKQLSSEITDLQAQQDEKNAEIEQLKKEYTNQGGISLEEWKQLNTQLKEEEEHRERINWERKAMAAEILPFIIVGPLLDKVHPQIVKEHQFKSWKAISESIHTEEFKNLVCSSIGKSGVPNANQLGSTLYEDIINFLIPANEWENFVPLFGLSDDEEMSVQAALNRVGQYDLKRIAGYRKRLDQSIKKSQEIREKLQQSSVENYQAHTEAISKITKEIYDLSLQSQNRQSELGICEENINTAEKEREAAYKELEIDIKRRSVSAISSKVLLLLEDLQNTIFNRLIRDVREDTLMEFNRLIRKRKFIDDIQIDEDFRVHLLRRQTVEKNDLVRICRRSGADGVRRRLRRYAFVQLNDQIGNPEEEDFGDALESYPSDKFELLMEINKDTLSKGETQVFVMSLYWAMMQQCKCELPFIIDTPFARIDADHRTNIVEQFFKRLPGQLFVLSTDEEISSKHMLALRDQVSNMFLLEYSDDKCTQIKKNQYFEVQ